MAQCIVCKKLLANGEGYWHSINQATGTNTMKSRTDEHSTVDPPRVSGQIINCLVCKNCNDKFVESLVTGKLPSASDKKDGCYIATAAYGSPLANEVNILRSFRDEILRKNRFGRAFVKMYNLFSPHLSRLIEQHSWLGKVSRVFLHPIVFLAKIRIKDLRLFIDKR